jgi:phenylalanyl-tRNA synthetase alpha chain
MFGAAAKAGQGKAFKNKWISKKGNNLVRLVDSIVDETQRDLKEVEASGTLSNAKLLAELKKRTLVDKQYDSLQ